MTASRLPPKPTGRLVTAEEFLRDYCEDYEELIDGVLVEKGMPSLRHGQVCAKAIRLIGNFVEANNLGQTMSNDSHILIHRDPDRMRGPDLCFFTFDRLPAGPAPDGVTDLVPDLTVEIRSPSNTWSQVFGKIGDYLKVGVRAVLVLDADSRTASVYRRDELQKIFTAEQEVTVPEVLPGFAVVVRKFFE
jgi:Uma2 family endonuclease